MSAKQRTGIFIAKPISPTARFLDFTIEREEWNVYKLADDSLVRTKFVLTGVLIDQTLQEIERLAESEDKLKIGFGIRSNTVFGVESPPKLRGPRDHKNYSAEELQAAIEVADLDFVTERETWSVYSLENGFRLKVKFSPTAISRTRKFDGGGIPVYYVESTVDVKLKLPDKIEEIRQRRKLATSKKAKPIPS